MKVKYLKNLPVKLGIDLDEISGTERELKDSIKQKSYIKLKEEEYQRAVARLHKK